MNTMRVNRKWKNPRWRPLNFECMYLCLHIRYQRKSNGYTHGFWVQLSNWTRADTARPNRKQKMAISELQISICTVLLVDQNFSYQMDVITRLQVKQSRICETFRAFHFRLVAHHSHKFQWNARPQKRRYSRWNFIHNLSGNGDSCIRSLEAAILDLSTSGLVAQSSHKFQWIVGPPIHGFSGRIVV